MSSTFKRRLVKTSSPINGVPVRPLLNVPDSVTNSTSLVTGKSTTGDTTTGSTTISGVGGFGRMPGTKPWTGGLTLTSTGLRELDAIISSAGQPLGSCIFIEEDRWTNHLSKALVQYWCAEVCVCAVVSLQKDLKLTLLKLIKCFFIDFLSSTLCKKL
jgi:PAXNEB protein